MNESSYNPKHPYRYVVYARMSTRHQNERSPESQVHMIQERLQQLGYNWSLVATYIDRAVSGRYDRKRPEYQRMLRELRSGIVKAEVVAVDTYDRFSRSKRGGQSRANLERQGVLVVTANNSFADPTTVAGRVMSAFEEERAREEGRVKGHQVRRGKLDALRQKRWPGGPIPLGMRLRPIMIEVAGVSTVSHNVLEPNPRTRWIVEMMFLLAIEKGYGSSRIAEALNNDQRVVDLIGKVSGATVAEILKRRVYTGELVWNLEAGDIVDDVRILRKVPENEWVRIPEFCEPIVSVEDWDQVNLMRKARNRFRSKDDSGGGIAGLCAPGIALKYPCSGILICGICGRSMTVSSSPAYVGRDGQSRRYVYYGCPGYKQGRTCGNRRHIPEHWIREEVFRILRKVLKLEEYGSDSEPLEEIIQLASQLFDRQASKEPSRLDGLLAAKGNVESQLQGWLLSLGNPQLPPSVRRSIETKLLEGETRLNQLVGEIDSIAANKKLKCELLDREVIMERLKNFARVLSADNAAAASLMLSQHIQGVYCFPDGRCELRLFMLGVLTSELDFLPFESNSLQIEKCAPRSDGAAIDPRRRTKRDARAAIHDDDVLDAANEFAVDPDRFAGLPSELFSLHVLQAPEPTSWGRRNFADVAAYRQAHQATMEDLAAHFGVSIPTIRKGLRAAEKSSNLKLTGKIQGRDNKRNWAKPNAQLVAEYMSDPMSTITSAVTYFGKSELTIKKALDYATGRRKGRRK